jgi:hypothetical protein
LDAEIRHEMNLTCRYFEGKQNMIGLVTEQKGKVRSDDKVVFVINEFPAML